MPLPMTSNQGCILTINLAIGADLADIVIPCAANSDTDGHGDATCRRAVQAARDTLLALILPMLTTTCKVRSFSAAHMDNGFKPYAVGLAVGEATGTVTGGFLTPEVGTVVRYYPYVDDRVAGARLKHSRMTIPGVPASATSASGQLLTSGDYWDAVQAFAAALVDGFSDSSETVPVSFFRVLAAPPPTTKGGRPNTPLVRLDSTPIVRNNLGVQRRRILPV